MGTEWSQGFGITVGFRTCYKQLEGADYNMTSSWKCEQDWLKLSLLENGSPCSIVTSDILLLGGEVGHRGTERG
jgi:hypothetical protein